MSALKFLDLLSNRQILSDKVVATLRKQIEQSSKDISAESLASLLVSKGQLTDDQAKRLLDVTTPPPLPAPDEELGLAPDDSGVLGLSHVTSLDIGDDYVEPVLVEEDSADDLRWDDAAPVSEVVADVGEPSDPELPEVDEPRNPVDVLLDEAESMDDGAAILTRQRGFAGLMGRLGAKRGPRKYRANQWDSPLMLVGGGALLLLTIVGIALYMLLWRGTGDEAFDAANDNYRQQAYGQAIHQFQEFVSGYPDHPKVGLAQIRIGMAKIWNQVERQRWPEALGAVQSELPPLVDQDSFAEARPELASLLPEIMDGFADRALQAKDIPTCEEYLARANQTLEHVNNSAYLPTSVRLGQQPRIEQILTKLQSVERRINRDRELERTVNEIRTVLQDQQIAAAYRLRQNLLKTYPILETDVRLNEAVLEINEAERMAVRPIANPPEPLVDEPVTASQYRVAITNRRGDAIAEMGDDRVFVRAQGAVYGIQAADGRVVWRRYVGFRSESTPLSLEGVGQADVVAMDPRRQELVRFDGRTGKTVWRLRYSGQPTQPTLQAGRLWLAGSDDDTGYLMAIDPTTGDVVGGVTTPVPISVSPFIDVPRQQIVQPMSHSTVYVFGLQSWDCLAVNFLGHSRDTVAVPPIFAGDAILIAENPGIDFSLLHTLQFDSENDGVLRALADPQRIEGQIVVPLQAMGRRIVVATDRGKIQALELDAAGTNGPLRVAAEAVATVPAGSFSYFLLDDGRLWVGDAQLTRYELQTSRGALVRKWLNSKGDRFVAPLQLRGSTLLHQRHRLGRLGTTVAAVHVGPDSDGRREGQAIWEVDLGVPVVGEPFVDRSSQEIQVMTANGVLFAVGKEAIRGGVVDSGRRELLDPNVTSLEKSITVSRDLRAYSPGEGATRFALLDSTKQALRVLEMEIGGQQPVSFPTAFHQQLLVPTDAGAVYLLDPATGRPAMPPFQSPSESGVKTQWLRPKLMDGGDRSILADARGHLYQLSVESSPRDHLAAVQTQQMDAPFILPPVATSNNLFGVVRGTDHDILRRMRVQDFQLQDQVDLPGRVVWGPHAIGSHVLLMTDRMHLLGFHSDRRTMAIDALTSTAVGEPVSFNDGFLIATIDGFLWHVAVESGDILGKVEIGESLATGPVQYSENRFMVCGGDGTLHVVSVPTE